MSAELCLARLYHLHLELLGLFLSALVPYVAAKLAISVSMSGVVLAELRLANLHHLHKELFGLLPVPCKRQCAR